MYTYIYIFFYQFNMYHIYFKQVVAYGTVFTPMSPAATAASGDDAGGGDDAGKSAASGYFNTTLISLCSRSLIFFFVNYNINYYIPVQ